MGNTTGLGDGTELRGRLVTLRPVHREDAVALRELRASAKVARWWDPPEDPDWPCEEGGSSTRLTVLEDGALVGLAQWWAEEAPQYRHAGIDLFLDPRVHGRGLGTDTVRTLARHLFEHVGHHRVVIDPAAANAAAIRCYEKVGFRRVGVMRRYERNPGTDSWRDGMLMDLLPEDLTAAPDD
ncbi:MAG: hypothetical protein QOJ60_1404 [Actinomycetota bacterium]|nr:hypothetical protein [Actinomycetota bacterium]